jgi:DNA-binding SARP family transcriptional activator
MTRSGDREGAALLELLLLGPVEAGLDGTMVPLAPLERNLIAILAMSSGSVLSTDRIIERLWGNRPPAAPRSRVQGLVSALRRKLGAAVLTRSPGYLLADADCDARRCEELSRAARRADSPARTAALAREALGLWRGEALDGVTAPGLDADRARLAELRIGLTEELFDAELALGEGAELVRELFAAVAAHPLRERLTGQLMRALYRANRQAEALGAYQSLRDRLAEELGSDPCPDLRELHMTILRGAPLPPGPADAVESLVVAARTEPPKPSDDYRPAQMPAGVGHFVGRDCDLAALTAALPGPGDEPKLLLISAAGGLGKTALAVQWAHSVSSRFSDGQIFVDLKGSAATGALTPGSALGAVLLALGVSADSLPVSVDERAALYRTLTHGRRVLVVADDAGAINQLLPLVPPTAGSVLVATSRTRLSALTAYHAVYTHTLEPLSRTASRDLLGSIVGAQRLRGEGATDVVQLCGGWPLALRLAGATLVTRARQSLVSFANELRERVDVLSVADDPRSVRAALAQAHDSLEPAAARLFGQLGVLPGKSVCLQLAAAATGTSTLRARMLLDELISANLVVEVDPDRYSFHDMIARYARRCGSALTDRVVVEERVTRWYLGVFEAIARGLPVEQASHQLAGQIDWVPTDADDPARFVAAESANLPAVIAWVAARGNAAVTWQLVSRAYRAAALLPPSAYELGLAAAITLGDRLAVGEAEAALGIAQSLDPSVWESAAAHLTVAVDLLESADGPLPGLASFALAALFSRHGRVAEAQDEFQRTLRRLDPSREPMAYAVALLGSAVALTHDGAVEAARGRFAQALILCEATGGSRFSSSQGELNGSMVDEFLTFLTRSVLAPRVHVADRRLAQTMMDLHEAVRLPAAVAAGPVRRRLTESSGQLLSLSQVSESILVAGDQRY